MDFVSCLLLLFQGILFRIRQNTFTLRFGFDEASEIDKLAVERNEFKIDVEYDGHPKDYKTTSQEAVIEEVVTFLLEDYNNTDRRYLKYA